MGSAVTSIGSGKESEDVCVDDFEAPSSTILALEGNFSLERSRARFDRLRELREEGLVMFECDIVIANPEALALDGEMNQSSSAKGSPPPGEWWHLTLVITNRESDSIHQTLLFFARNKPDSTPVASFVVAEFLNCKRRTASRGDIRFVVLDLIPHACPSQCIEIWFETEQSTKNFGQSRTAATCRAILLRFIQASNTLCRDFKNRMNNDVEGPTEHLSIEKGLRAYLQGKNDLGMNFLERAKHLLREILASECDLAAEYKNQWEIGTTEVADRIRQQALTITGYCARFSQILYIQSERWPWFPRREWLNLQALQEYQIRQLVEEMVFSQIEQHAFLRWVSKMPEAVLLQGSAIQKRLEARGKIQGVTEKNKLRKWAQKNAALPGGERFIGMFEDAEDFELLLSPALDMLRKMDNCCAPVQYVRLWAEAGHMAVETIIMKLQKPMEGGGMDHGFAAPDHPALVHALGAMSESDYMIYNALIAKLFTPTDLFGSDLSMHEFEKEVLLEGIGDQYFLDWEREAVDPVMYLGWMLDGQVEMIMSPRGPHAPEASKPATTATSEREKVLLENL